MGNVFTNISNNSKLYDSLAPDNPYNEDETGEYEPYLELKYLQHRAGGHALVMLCNVHEYLQSLLDENLDTILQDCDVVGVSWQRCTMESLNM